MIVNRSLINRPRNRCHCCDHLGQVESVALYAKNTLEPVINTAVGKAMSETPPWQVWLLLSQAISEREYWHDIVKDMLKLKNTKMSYTLWQVFNILYPSAETVRNICVPCFFWKRMSIWNVIGYLKKMRTRNIWFYTC